MTYTENAEKNLNNERRARWDAQLDQIIRLASQLKINTNMSEEAIKASLLNIRRATRSRRN